VLGGSGGCEGGWVQEGLFWACFGACFAQFLPRNPQTGVWGVGRQGWGPEGPVLGLFCQILTPVTPKQDGLGGWSGRGLEGYGGRMGPGGLFGPVLRPFCPILTPNPKQGVWGRDGLGGSGGCRVREDLFWDRFAQLLPRNPQTGALGMSQDGPRRACFGPVLGLFCYLGYMGSGMEECWGCRGMSDGHV